MKHIQLLLIVLILSLSAGTVYLYSQVDEKYLNHAEKFVQLLSSQEFTDAVIYFDNGMREALSAEQLQEMWEGVQKQWGAFEKQVDTKSQERENLTIVFVTCEFAKKKMDMQIALNAELKIAGLWIVPSDL